MAEEEVLIEVEAVLAMYGDDCVILESFPPHLHLHIKPRTADISSQQVPHSLPSSFASEVWLFFVSKHKIREKTVRELNMFIVA